MECKGDTGTLHRTSWNHERIANCTRNSEGQATHAKGPHTGYVSDWDAQLGVAGKDKLKADIALF